MTRNTNTIELRDDQQWLVVKTKPRSEKKFAEYCLRLHLTYYLPVRKSVKHYGRRTVEFTIPMFPGYVFAQINPDNKIKLLESRQSAQIITPDPKMEIRLVEELSDIQRLLEATEAGKLVVRPEIEIGQAVQIRSGVLAGLNGIVTRRNNKTRVTVNVEMIGYSVSIDLDVNELELDF